jgi:hypothetical protein
VHRAIGNTVIFGVPGTAVYVYAYAGQNVWAQQAALTEPGSAAFGSSVALSADGNRKLPVLLAAQTAKPPRCDNGGFAFVPHARLTRSRLASSGSVARRREAAGRHWCGSYSSAAPVLWKSELHRCRGWSKKKNGFVIFLTQIKVNLREPVRKLRPIEGFYKNAQLFCAGDCCCVDHARDLVCAI